MSRGNISWQVLILRNGIFGFVLFGKESDSCIIFLNWFFGEIPHGDTYPLTNFGK